MIARLVGTLVAHDDHRGIVDVHGVGYAVHAPLADLATWAQADEPVVVHVSTDVREDAITLFGFADDVDRVAFERLRVVNGVGPKVALSTLDTLGLQGLATAVAADDVAGLTRVPGVGKKLAQRLALELKGKLPVAFEASTAPVAPAKKKEADPLDLALARLGYTRSEIVKAHEGLAADGLGHDAPVAQRLQAALRLLSGS